MSTGDEPREANGERPLRDPNLVAGGDPLAPSFAGGPWLPIAFGTLMCVLAIQIYFALGVGLPTGVSPGSPASITSTVSPPRFGDESLKEAVACSQVLDRVREAFVHELHDHPDADLGPAFAAVEASLAEKGRCPSSGSPYALSTSRPAGSRDEGPTAIGITIECAAHRRFGPAAPGTGREVGVLSRIVWVRDARTTRRTEHRYAEQDFQICLSNILRLQHAYAHKVGKHGDARPVDEAAFLRDQWLESLPLCPADNAQYVKTVRPPESGAGEGIVAVVDIRCGGVHDVGVALTCKENMEKARERMRARISEPSKGERTGVLESFVSGGAGSGLRCPLAGPGEEYRLIVSPRRVGTIVDIERLDIYCPVMHGALDLFPRLPKPFGVHRETPVKK